ncbi:hypothetical protein DSL72_009461 [Monilinia vaccinii-corymbosi]|uniref:Uncharacterized protein n=1 Tax=Monilinia vaccinii-corymbosi TaxID=61207 RepID=A0A8A3PQT5_9HELO|nr:hypothetical protein DSL72_009461 [Monilinia vaccinii-corymbosi]
MGNGQSVPARPQRSKKLSKPKTKSTGRLSSTHNSPNASRRNSVTGKGIIAAAATVLPHGKPVGALETASREHTPESTPTKKKRMSVFKSRHSKKDMGNSQLDGDIDTVPTASPPITTGEFTRSNSANSVIGEVTKKKSWAALNPKLSFHRSRRSLTHISITSNNSNRLSLVPETLPSRPDSLNIGTDLAGQNCGEMDWQLSDPLCQRSQSDPAIYAPIRRKSLLQPGVATRPSVMSNALSFQSQIPASYHNIESWSASPLTLRTNMDRDTPGARTSTPNDLGHIGSFQLGSLRITNGSASPTPSAEERRASLPAHDTHIATLQASSNFQGIAHRSHTISVPPGVTKRPWARTSFPQSSAENSSHDPLTIKIPDAISNLHSSLSAINTQSLILPPQLSPFSFIASPVGSPLLEATSKGSTTDDELSEAEISTPALEPSSGNDNRSFDSACGPSPATPEQQVLGRAQGPRDMISKPLVMTDNGYSSSTSGRNSTALVLKISLKTTEAPPSTNNQSINHSNSPDTTHAIPMVSPELQRTTRLSNYSSPTYQSEIQQPRPMHYRQSMPAAAPRQPQKLAASEYPSSQWGVQRQRPQSYHPGAPGLTAQCRSRSENHLPNAASYQNGERVNELMGYKSMRTISSKETITTITSLDLAEVESAYTKQSNAIPPIPTSIPEEDYHTGWKPPNVRMKPYAPSAPSTPRNRYHTPTSLNTYPQEDQTDFENHLTSLENIKNSLGGSPYDLALTAMETKSPRVTPRAALTPRMERMTTQPRSAHADGIRSQTEKPSPSRPGINALQESNIKLVGGSPVDNVVTEPSLRATSSGSTFTLRDLPSQRRTAEEDVKRLSITRTNRVNSPPPSSFQSHRKSAPVHVSRQSILPILSSPPVEQSLSQPLSPEIQTSQRKETTPPPPPPPPPQRSCTSNIVREVTSQESLKSEQEIWVDSAEQRDVPSPLQMGFPERSTNVRSQSARPAYHRPIPNHHFSFDFQNNSGKSSRATSLYSEKEWEIHAGTYDHTYGSSTNLHEFSGDNSGIEYDSPYSEEPQEISQVGNSTRDMLILDRYAGGLGCGFEPDYGLGGRAGTINGGTMNKGGKGVDVSEDWGVDVSDVPIMMQRVPVRAGI